MNINNMYMQGYFLPNNLSGSIIVEIDSNPTIYEPSIVYNAATNKPKNIEYKRAYPKSKKVLYDSETITYCVMEFIKRFNIQKAGSRYPETSLECILISIPVIDKKIVNTVINNISTIIKDNNVKIDYVFNGYLECILLTTNNNVPIGNVNLIFMDYDKCYLLQTEITKDKPPTITKYYVFDSHIQDIENELLNYLFSEVYNNMESKGKTREVLQKNFNDHPMIAMRKWSIVMNKLNEGNKLAIGSDGDLIDILDKFGISLISENVAISADKLYEISNKYIGPVLNNMKGIIGTDVKTPVIVCCTFRHEMGGIVDEDYFKRAISNVFNNPVYINFSKDNGMKLYNVLNSYIKSNKRVYDEFLPQPKTHACSYCKNCRVMAGGGISYHKYIKYKTKYFDLKNNSIIVMK